MTTHPAWQTAWQTAFSSLAAVPTRGTRWLLVHGLGALVLRLLSLTLALLTLAALLLPPAQAADYLEVDQAFRGSAQRLDDRSVQLGLDVAPGYHLYRERMSVLAGDPPSALPAAELPRGRTQFDSNLGRPMELLEGAVRVRVPLPDQARAGTSRLLLQYQGCADEGLCYPPQTAAIDVDMAEGRVAAVRWLGEPPAPAVAEATAASGSGPGIVVPGTATTPPVPLAASGDASETSPITQALRSGHWPTLVAAFGLAGLLLSFTPCVLPMVPILSSIIVGQQASVSRGRGFALALSYVLGMALVYTGMGMAAGLAGEGLAASLQNPWVLGAFALLLVGLALSMFGLYELQLPAALQSRLSARSNRLPGGRLLGVFLMGGLSALIVGPCVAAPLAGALVFIGQTRDVVVGGVALFSLAMGMGVPLLLVGLSAGTLLPRAGAWMNGVKTLFGVVLLAVALWIVSPVLPKPLLMLIVGAALLVGACPLGLFGSPRTEARPGQRLLQGAGLVMAVLGITQVVGALSGGTDPLQPLAHLARASAAPGPTAAAVAESGYRRIRTLEELDQALRASRQPLMVDVVADWCVACREMEHLTLRHPTIAPRLAALERLQIDVTANGPHDKALLKRFGLFGPPGILFFAPGGAEHAQSRVIGYEPPDRFAAAMARAGL